MNMQKIVIVESLESMATVACLALNGNEEEQKTMRALNLPIERGELIGFLKGLKFVNDIIRATSEEPTQARLGW